MVCRPLIYLACLSLSLPACEAMSKFAKQLPRPGHPAMGQQPQKAPTQTAATSQSSGSVAQSTPATGTPAGTGQATVGPLNALPANAENGWTLQPLAAGVSTLGMTNGSGETKLLFDPASPTAFAVVGMQGSRYAVAVRDKLYGGFDAVHALPAQGRQPSWWFAFSPDGERFGFLATRGGQTFYVVDGKEGPSYEAQAHVFGPLIFSDDSQSFAYQVFSHDIVLDGLLVGADDGVYDASPGAVNEVSGFGFGAGTHALHYARRIKMIRPGDGAYVIVSGEKHWGLEQTGDVNAPGFLSDGTAYWYDRSQTASSQRTMLVVDGESIGLVDSARPAQDPSSPETLGQPELLSYVFDEEDHQSRVAIYSWVAGQGKLHALPQGLAEDTRWSQPVVSADGSHVMYTVSKGDSRSLVVDQAVSPSYESIYKIGFTPNGRAVALVLQGRRMFTLLDAVEQPGSIMLKGYLTMHIAEQGERVFFTNSHNLHLLGEVKDGAFILEALFDEDEDLRPTHFRFNKDGTKLFCNASLRHRENGNLTSKVTYSILQNGEVLTSTTETPGADYALNADGSVVLWPTRVPRTHGYENLHANNAVYGPMLNFGDACFGQGQDYAFSATTVGELVRGKPDPSTMDPRICVNGRFFRGLRPLHPGHWVGELFYVLSTRDTDAGDEVVMARHDPR